MVFAYVTFGALHDIATGLEADVSTEYAVLLMSGCWWAFITARLFKSSHAVFGGVSVLVLVAAVWGSYALSAGMWGAAPYRTLAGVALWYGLLSLLLFVWMDPGTPERVARPG